MQISCKGLIIKEEQIGDYDRIVTILTAEHGIIRSFATGARRIKSKKISSTALFAYSYFSLAEKKGTYRIAEAEPIEIFFHLRKNIVNMALASYFCSVALLLAPKEEGAEELLRLLLNSFYLLSEDKNKNRLIKAVFEYRVMCQSGYMADLLYCSSCGAELNLQGGLSLSGDVFCPDCAKGNDKLFILSPSVYKALLFISQSDIGNLFSFRLSEESTEYLNILTERYLEYQSENHFKTLDFYKTLL